MIHRLLLLLPAEFSHRVVICALRFLQLIYFRWLRRPLTGHPSIVISSVPRIRFKNRLGLAAGFDKNAEAFAALNLMGFGFVEIGTVTPLPQVGNPSPRVWRTQGNTLVNCLGFNNVGLDEFYANILRYRQFVSDTPLFANIGKGFQTDNQEALQDYVRSAQKLFKLVDGLVVNISSPNTPGLVGLQTVKFLESLSSHLPDDMPTFIKLSPDLMDEDFRELCDLIRHHSSFHGLVLTNTSQKLARSAGFEKGGLSGPPLLQGSLSMIGIAREIVPRSKLIIGVGGISSVDDAIAMRHVGADLVEILTSFVYQGPNIVKELGRALNS